MFIFLIIGLLWLTISRAQNVTICSNDTGPIPTTFFTPELAAFNETHYLAVKISLTQGYRGGQLALTYPNPFVYELACIGLTELHVCKTITFIAPAPSCVQALETLSILCDNPNMSNNVNQVRLDVYYEQGNEQPNPLLITPFVTKRISLLTPNDGTDARDQAFQVTLWIFITAGVSAIALLCCCVSCGTLLCSRLVLLKISGPYKLLNKV